MKSDAFDALAKLLRLRAGPSREAARMVFVDGVVPADAARAVDISPAAVGNVMRACRLGMDLVKIASAR